MSRIWVLLWCVALACRSAGAYSYSTSYVPLSEEEKSSHGAKEFDPVMAKRFPKDFQHVALFGVVTARGSGPNGTAELTLSVRRLEPRNLCINHLDEDTCRVTVSDTEFAQARAWVRVLAEDDVGEHALMPGSMVRLVGDVDTGALARDGSVVVRGSYYRHFPRFAYRTRADSVYMKQ